MENAIKRSSFIKRIFSTSSSTLRKKLLQSSNDDIIRAISEILLNIYHRNINLPKEVIKGLRKAKGAVLKIINKKTSMTKRKELLIANSEALLGIRQVFKK